MPIFCKGIGAIRDINLITQGYVQHELIAYNDNDYSFSYKLTGGKPVGMHDYVVVAKITAINKAKFLLISGKPIGEQIARGGPFVMNTKKEIQQAIEDYHSGKFVK